MTWEMWQQVFEIAKGVSGIVTLAILLIKPLRERVLGIKLMNEGTCCLLRTEITRLYYKNLESRRLRQYEYECLEHCYRAYKARGGNSFVDHIYREMQEWEVVR